jgi:hypothetical protein
VDGTFVEVPRQRNTKEENAQIKQGEVPANFTANKHKQSQKDVDAVWTKRSEKGGLFDDLPGVFYKKNNCFVCCIKNGSYWRFPVLVGANVERPPPYCNLFRIGHNTS